MTTEPMKRYDELYSGAGGVFEAVGIGECQEGQYLDRDDMPVESLRFALDLCEQRKGDAMALAGRDDINHDARLRIIANTEQHIAALERLLGACE